MMEIINIKSRSDCNSCHVHNFPIRVLEYYVIRGILWLFSAHCLVVRQREKKQPMLVFPMQECIFMQQFDSVREKDFNLHFSARNRNYIQQKALHERFHCIECRWYLNFTQNI